MMNNITLAEAMADFYNTTEMVVMPWEEETAVDNIKTVEEAVEWWEEEERWERETREWLRNHSGNPADPNYDINYSDIYKDLYGFRPRW